MITRRQFVGVGLGGLAAARLAGVAGLLLAVPGKAHAQEEEFTVRQAISQRRTIRDFSASPLSLEQLLGVLWAAQGITDPSRRFRAAPSAGALFPLEVFVVVGEEAVGGLPAGTYRFTPEDEDLDRLREGDLRRELAESCMGQMWAGRAPVSIVIGAVFSRVTRKYANRGIAFAQIEAGCAAENVFLMAVSTGLATGIIGALSADQVAEVIGYQQKFEPLLVMPLGYPA